MGRTRRGRAEGRCGGGGSSSKRSPRSPKNCVGAAAEGEAEAEAGWCLAGRRGRAPDGEGEAVGPDTERETEVGGRWRREGTGPETERESEDGGGRSRRWGAGGRREVEAGGSRVGGGTFRQWRQQCQGRWWVEARAGEEGEERRLGRRGGAAWGSKQGRATVERKMEPNRSAPCILDLTAEQAQLKQAEQLAQQERQPGNRVCSGSYDVAERTSSVQDT